MSTDPNVLAALRAVGPEFAAAVLHYHQGTLGPVAYVPQSCHTCETAAALAERVLADLHRSAFVGTVSAAASSAHREIPLILCELPLNRDNREGGGIGWCKRRIAHGGPCSPKADG